MDRGEVNTSQYERLGQIRVHSCLLKIPSWTALNREVLSIKITPSDIILYKWQHIKNQMKFWTHAESFKFEVEGMCPTLKNTYMGDCKFMFIAH